MPTDQSGGVFFDSDLGSFRTFSQIFFKSQRDTIVLEWVLEIEEVFRLHSFRKRRVDANRQSPGKGEMPMVSGRPI